MLSLFLVEFTPPSSSLDDIFHSLYCMCSPFYLLLLYFVTLVLTQADLQCILVWTISCHIFQKAELDQHRPNCLSRHWICLQPIRPMTEEKKRVGCITVGGTFPERTAYNATFHCQPAMDLGNAPQTERQSRSVRVNTRLYFYYPCVLSVCFMCNVRCELLFFSNVLYT